jgi:hypothetical protein
MSYFWKIVDRTMNAAAAAASGHLKPIINPDSIPEVLKTTAVRPGAGVRQAAAAAIERSNSSNNNNNYNIDRRNEHAEKQPSEEMGSVVEKKTASSPEPTISTIKPESVLIPKKNQLQQQPDNTLLAPSAGQHLDPDLNGEPEFLQPHAVSSPTTIAPVAKTSSAASQNNTVSSNAGAEQPQGLQSSISTVAQEKGKKEEEEGGGGGENSEPSLEPEDLPKTPTANFLKKEAKEEEDPDIAIPDDAKEYQVGGMLLPAKPSGQELDLLHEDSSPKEDYHHHPQVTPEINNNNAKKYIPAAVSQPETVVRINIGRIEVRAAALPPGELKPMERKEFLPPLSLDEYLKQRREAAARKFE